MITAALHRLVSEIVRLKVAGETLGEMKHSVRDAAECTFDLLEPGLGDYATLPA